MAYYPGSEGGQAIAETLFGQNSHEGALPFTWPASVGDGVASDHAHVGVGNTGPDPQLHFGAGRGETTIQGVDPSSISRYGSASVPAIVRVHNPLDHAVTIPVVVRGRAVGQGATERDPVTTSATRVVGFDRAAVGANGSTTVSVPLDLAALGTVRGDVVGDGDRVLPAGTDALTTGHSQSRLTVSETAPIE